MDARIDGKLIDYSKRVIIASCYGHTFALGRSRRAEGGANSIFFTLKDGDDYTSAFGFVEPLATDGLIDNKTPGSPIPRAAPDYYLHPVHALRLHRDHIGSITEVDFAIRRVIHVNSRKVDLVTKTYRVDPIDQHELDGVFAIVQSIDRPGPNFLDRGVIPQ